MHICPVEIFCTVIALNLCAAAQAAPSTPVFKSRTDLVVVPVLVHDKDGKHIPGLKASDFTVEDNGAKQKVVAADEVKAETGATAVETEQTEDIRRGVIFTNQLANPEKPKELTIFAMDLVNAPFVETVRGRRAMLSFLETHMSPDRPMGLVAIEPGGVRLLHAFTESPVALTAALKKVTAVMTSPVNQARIDDQAALIDAQQSSLRAQFALEGLSGEVASSAAANTLAMAAFIAEARVANSQAWLNSLQARRNQDIASTLESLRSIAGWVSGIPGRKVLVWMTGDIPFVLQQGDMALGNLDKSEYDKTMEALAAANVALYPVDVRGVVPEEMLNKAYLDALHLQAETMLPMDASPTGIQQRTAALRSVPGQVRDSHAAMNYLADATGGRAYYNRNDIPRVLDDAVTDSSRYYIVSYYLDRKRAKPGWHKLKVSVQREGTRVRARSGFVVPKPGQEASASARQSDENTAMTSPFDFTALPITLRWSDIKPQGDKRRVSFQVYIPASAELVSPDNATVDLDFIATATANDRTIAGRSAKAFRTTLKPDGVQKIQTYGLTYVSDLDVKPGQYAVRLVVRDNRTGRIGSINARLQVAP